MFEKIIAVPLFLLRIILVILLVLLGMTIVGVIFPFIGHSPKNTISTWWAKALMWVSGVKIKVEGNPIMTGPVMMAANHVSWIDIFVLNSVRNASFVAKSEIRSWPVLGHLVAGVGTIFIERSHRQSIKIVSQEINRLFDEQACVGLFPEGTTTDGFGMLPLHTSLLEPALRAGVPIQPVALLFLHKGKRSGITAFVGEQNLLQNLWILLSKMGVGVTIRFLPVINADPANNEISRTEVATQLKNMIEKELIE